MNDADRSRLAAFHRMRWWAISLLLAVTATFFAISVWGEKLAIAPLIIAFSEAAMVGGLADWFAVTALFRQPLGISSKVLKIPHTEIIPRNKKRIGQGLGKVVVDNFLTPEGVAALVRRENPAARVAAWFEEPRNVLAVIERVQGWLPLMFEEMNRDDVREVIGRGLVRILRSVPLAPVAGNVLWKFRVDGYQSRLLTLLIDRFQELLENNQGRIYQAVKDRSSWWVPVTLNDYVTKQIVSSLRELLQNLMDPIHPHRGKLEKELMVFINKMQHDEAFRVAGETMKEKILGDGNGAGHGQAMWDELYSFLQQDIAQGKKGITGGMVERGVSAFATLLASDRRLQMIINRWLQGIAIQIISRNREKIVAYFVEKVTGWDDRTLVSVSETYVGRDLQYIRINGTLVGGAVGVILYGIKSLL